MPTPRFGLPYIAQGQAQKEVTHNDALNQLDALVDLYFLDRDLAAPRAPPARGLAMLARSPFALMVRGASMPASAACLPTSPTSSGS
jgi:hypothetical protein